MGHGALKNITCSGYPWLYLTGSVFCNVHFMLKKGCKIHFVSNFWTNTLSKYTKRVPFNFQALQWIHTNLGYFIHYLPSCTSMCISEVYDYFCTRCVLIHDQTFLNQYFFLHASFPFRRMGLPLKEKNKVLISTTAHSALYRDKHSWNQRSKNLGQNFWNLYLLIEGSQCDAS